MPAPAETIRVQLEDHGETVVRDVPLDAYAAAAALSEFAPAAGTPSAVEAMYEVQTIVARTYAAAHRARHAREGFDLCSSTHCQLYDPGRLFTSRWADAARLAAERTAGLVVLYDGLPADAVFHADCGGSTTAAADVWGGAGRPYLPARADDGAASGAHASWQYAVDADALGRMLDASPQSRLGGSLTAVTVDARDASGRVARLRLHPSGGGVDEIYVPFDQPRERTLATRRDKVVQERAVAVVAGDLITARIRNSGIVHRRRDNLPRSGNPTSKSGENPRECPPACPPRRTGPNRSPARR